MQMSFPSVARRRAGAKFAVRVPDEPTTLIKREICVQTRKRVSASGTRRFDFAPAVNCIGLGVCD